MVRREVPGGAIHLAHSIKCKIAGYRSARSPVRRWLAQWKVSCNKNKSISMPWHRWTGLNDLVIRCGSGMQTGKTFSLFREPHPARPPDLHPRPTALAPIPVNPTSTSGTSGNANDAQRIRFAPGSTSATVTGTLAASESDQYVLRAVLAYDEPEPDLHGRPSHFGRLG